MIENVLFGRSVFRKPLSFFAIGLAFPTVAFSQDADTQPSPDRIQETTPSAEGATAGNQEFIFLDPDGNPLPPEVQAQLRESMLASQQEPAEDDGSIVVRGLQPRGSVEYDVVPQQSFSPLQLRALGAGNIEELIEALDAQLSTLASDEGSRPVLLLNGRRTTNPLDIATIPTEAVERVDVFDEQLAVQYGFRPNVKVVNIVTYESYDALTVFGTAMIATDGGYGSGDGSFQYFGIEGDTRYAAGLNYRQSADLTEEERSIQQLMNGSGFGSSRTLLPRISDLSINGNVARPVSNSVNASLSGRYRQIISKGLAGTFEGGVVESRREISDFVAALGLATELGRFIITSDSVIAGLSETAVFQQRGRGKVIDASDFESRDLSTDLAVSGPIADLPGGTMTLSAVSRAGRSRIVVSEPSALGSLRSERERDSTSLSLGVNVPILPSEGAIGRLASSANFIWQTFSDVEDIHRFSADLTWMPIKRFRFTLAYSLDQRVPTLEQLGRPDLRTPNVRTLDFVTGDTVDVSLITGGNSQLKNEDRRDIRLRASYKASKPLGLTIAATYFSTRTNDPIASFPVLTEDSVDAFSTRFARDAEGTLQSIDVRPLNFAESAQDRMRWGLSFSRSLGPVPSGLLPEGQDIDSVEDAQLAFPDAIILTTPTDSTNVESSENFASRLFFNVYHTWFFRDEVMLTTGNSPLDLLDGGAVDFLGGRRQHRLELDAGFYKDGLGFRIGSDWNSPTALINSSAVSSENLDFESYAVADLSLFANLADALVIGEKNSIFTNTRVSLTIENIFNRRPRVFDADDDIPLQYQGAIFDPLGRTVSLSLRKIF